MMEVKGEAVLSIPIFILKKLGSKEYNRWLSSLSPEAKKVYSKPINKSDWFPIKDIMIEPTKKCCELFFNNSKRGAWKCGRYSAEYGLKGIYKVLVKLATPQILIKKASSIITSYYKPSDVEVPESGKNYAIVRITDFADMDKTIEYRIGGWMERATEICGCRNVTVTINSSLTENDPYTEYKVSWKTKL
ncbi:MAG: hypothetical protein HOC71_12780 [Candidatus Latescibacteria bacterium]|jgi:hypothetical protein|nr:hypothetical protein [Candidatus Latescibacterota bacterium]